MNHELQQCARLLNSFNTLHHIQQGQQIHLNFLKRGVLNSVATASNRLLQMYIRCDRFGDARNLFDEIPVKNCFTWNILAEGYMKLGKVKELLEVFYAMPHRNDYSWNVVISGLSKAGELGMAHQLFCEMPRRNWLAWNSLIHGYAKNGYPRMALSLFRELVALSGRESRGLLRVDTFLFATVVGACADLRCLGLGKQIHGIIFVGAVEFDSVLGSSLVNMYGKCGDVDCARCVVNVLQCSDEFMLSALISGYANCGRMNDAKSVFDATTKPCVELWNTMIAGYVANDEVREALLLFQEMHEKGVFGDFSTFTSVLNACRDAGVLENPAQMHAQIFKLGVSHDLIVASSLLDTYAKCGSPDLACKIFSELKIHDTVLLNSVITIYSNCGRINDAKRIFDNMPAKSLISWNSMVVGLSQNGFPIEALNIFLEMNKSNISLDKVSLASVISSCAGISSLELGEQVFAKSIIIGVDSDEVVSTSLIDFYCKCGLVNDARKLFVQMRKYDVVSWNSMLMGYAANGCGVEVLNLFHEMIHAGLLPTDVAFTAVLSACDHCGLVEEGRKWFNAMKHDYHIDPGIEHYSCMIDLLSRAGCFDEAIHMISIMPFEADTSLWSSVLRGCVAHGNKSLGEKVVEQIVEIDPHNLDAHVQLSTVFAAAGDWEQSALIRRLMRDKEIVKNPGRSWYGGNILSG